MPDNQKRVHSADIIKIHKNSGKVTAFMYDDFEKNPLPELQLRVKINLIKQEIDLFDHKVLEWRQILYFKEQYLTSEHPLFQEWVKFSDKLSKATGITPGMIRGREANIEIL